MSEQLDDLISLCGLFVLAKNPDRRREYGQRALEIFDKIGTPDADFVKRNYSKDSNRMLWYTLCLYEWGDHVIHFRHNMHPIPGLPIKRLKKFAALRNTETLFMIACKSIEDPKGLSLMLRAMAKHKQKRVRTIRTVGKSNISYGYFVIERNGDDFNVYTTDPTRGQDQDNEIVYDIRCPYYYLVLSEYSQSDTTKIAHIWPRNKRPVLPAGCEIIAELIR